MGIDFNKLKKHKKYNENFGNQASQKSINTQNKGVLNNNNTQITSLATVNRTDNNTIKQKIKARYEANMQRQTNAVLYKKQNAQMSSQQRAKENSWLFSTKKSNQPEQYQIKNIGDIRDNKRYTPEQKYTADTSTLYKSPTADSVNEELVFNIANKDNAKERAKIVNSLVNSKKEQQKLYTKVENYARQIKSQKDAEKINNDSKNGKIGSSVGHVAKGLPTGAVNTILNVGGTIASLNPNMDDNMANTAKSIANQYVQTNAQIDNGIVRKAGTVTHTIGNMLPGMAVGGAVGAAGATGALASNAGGIVNAISSGASSYLDTLNEEQTNKLNAFFTGLAKGTVTYGTEKIAGGNLIAKGSLDDVVAKGISKKITNSGAQWLASKVYEVGGEITEENLENLAGYLIDSLINNQKVSVEQIKEDFKQTSEDTFWTTLVLNALGLGGNTYNDVKNISNVQEENSKVIDNSNLSEEQKASLKRVAEKHNMTTEEVQNLINNPLQENLQETSQNQATESANNEVLQNNQQIIQKQNKMVQNANIEQITANEDLRVKIPGSNYKFEASGNQKIDNLRQDANKYFNNSEKARDYVGMLEKIITDKNIDIRLDANLKTPDGKIANGSYSNGIIIINPNSSKAGEFIAVHELTHAIGTKDMLNMVENYRKNNKEFDNAVQNLLKDYKSTELTEEALSDVSAQLFGNQEFINNVAQSNPNIFQKIYSEIKYLWHQFRGYKNQDQFVEDLYYKWTQAYKSNNLNKSNKYSIAGKNARNANITNMKEAIKLEKQGKSAQEIYEKTGWYRGNENKWRFEIDDSDANIILSDNKYTAINKEYSLNEILDFKELYNAYPELNNIKVKFVEGKEFAGQFDGKKIYIDINEYNNTETQKYIEDSLKMLDSPNASILYSENEILEQKDKFQKRLKEYNKRDNNKELKSVLLHEIQHYIQKEEGFSVGNTEKIAKLNKEKFINTFKEKINNLKVLHNTIGIKESMTEQQVLEAENNSEYAEQIKELKENLSKDYELYLKIKDMTPLEIYENTAGEQEARNVQDRMNLTAEERKLIIPFVKNENMIYNTSEGIINGGYKNAIQNNKSTAFPFKEQFKHERSNNYRNDTNSNSYTAQRGRSSTESNTRIETNGKRAKHDIRENLGNDKKLIKNQESENNSGSFNLPKLKEGYTRLYRGLENEYVANYDKTKLDNLNGYESWTDSYELAKAYGDNVYYIDVPISEIKNSIIDEDNTSETYGDRNLIYANNKPVGLKGKSGNEYMLYTEHDNYNNLKYNKIDNNTSMQDNQGRTLTKEQQEYFKDSKAIDENGKLLEVYHGTNEDFTKFDISYLGSSSGDVGFLGDGFYLATHKGEAEYYGGKIMKGYVNIKNPYNIKDLTKYNGKMFEGESSLNGLKIKNLVELNPQWRNIEIKNTTYGEIADEVTNYMDNVKVKKLGIIEDYNGNASGIMWEISFNGQKIKDESIINYTEEAIIGDNLNRHIKDKFGYINSNEIIQYITEENRFNKNIKTFREVLQEKGYDSIVQGNPQDTDEIVIFDSNQFKNIDNTNPTDNPDIRYSQNNQTWQEYLESNFKSEGTRTNLQDVRLPEKTKMSETQKNTKNSNTSSFSMQEKYIDKYNKYKQNIINKNQNTINNLISYKNDSIRSIEDSIKQKENLLKSKKNKDTKIANTIKMQIENLKTRKVEIESIYNEKIDKFNTKIDKKKLEIEVQKQMKKDVKQTLSQEIKPLLEGSETWQDKNKGIWYSRETAQRNIYDIIPNKEQADLINRTIFDPIQEHQANKTRAINELFEKINNLNLDKKKKYTYTENEDGKMIKLPTKNATTYKVDEATLAQLYIEKKITEEDLKNYGVNIDKIKNTAQTFTEILDSLYDQMNETVVKYGYSPIGKIENYFPHFMENKPDTIVGKIASLFGIDTTNQELPTEIAGKTENFKPGKTWNSNLLERKSDKTDYDALKALEKYIAGAEDIIHTTGDIQKLRQFGTELRYRHSEKGIQERIDEITNNEELMPFEQEEAIENILSNRNNHLHQLSHFATWLDDYTNVLANKKNSGDREFEKNFSRNMYTTMSSIESRIAANTIGGNLSVSLTNIAPLAQAFGTTKASNVIIGMLETTINDLKSFTGQKNTNFVNNSNFLTNRFGTDRISNKKISENLSDVLSAPMSAIDEFTAESIVRAKYRENLQEGMTEEDALKNADKYAKNLMADRSKGSLPVIFNNKNPMSKLITMFQVEPNNIVSNYLKDMPREAKNKTDLIWKTSKLIASSYAFNTIIMAIRGGNEVLPDPIRFVSYLTKWLFDDDEEERAQAQSDMIEAIVGATPFASNVAGLFGLEDVGRIPISNAMPNIANMGTLFDDEVSEEYKKETLIKEISKPLLYLGLPVGGAQLSKTIQGLATVQAGGSYKTNKEGERQLQFPVEENIGNAIKAGIFGKYSLSSANQYIDSGFKSLNAEATKLYDETGIDYNILSDYINFSSESSVQDENKYSKYEDENGKVYWWDKNTQTMYDSNYKQTNIDRKLLTKSSNKKQLVDYINKLNITDKQKIELYKYNIVSDVVNEEGKTAQDEMNYMLKNGMSDKEYLQTYQKALDNNITFPNQEIYDKLKKVDLSVSKYLDYKKDVADRKLEETKDTIINNSDENISVNQIEKMKILQDKKYSSKEKDAIYSTFIQSKAKEGKTTEYEDLREYYANNSVLGSKNYRAYDIIEQYIDYKVKSSDKLEELRANGTKTENQNLSDEEKAQLLVESKYTNPQTEALYVNVVASDTNKEKYEIVKQMNGGNKINTYLEYVLADKTSDKEDDGTKNGKSISGTKKKKVVSAIQNTKLNKISKIYLLGTEYDLNTNKELPNYYALKNYLKTQSKSDQLRIVKTLKGKTEMKDGSYNY